MNVLEYAGWVTLTVVFFWLALALLFHLGKLHGWVVDIPEGHPDEYGSMDMRERGLR